MPVASNWLCSVSIHLRRSPRVTSPTANQEGYDNMGNGSAWQVKNEDMELLHEAISKQQPHLLHLLNSLGRVPLSEEERTSLRLAVTGELCATGFEEHDEPNARGLRLEKLIDYLGHR